jgi:parallel beta-helix repeat protein/predicted outer membrane repeat protein
MRLTCAVLSVLILTLPAGAAILTVDDDGPALYRDIATAVKAAVAGDTILIADGTYRGPNNRAIDPAGKAITVKSINGPAQCIIDCQNQACGFHLNQNETRQTVIEGLTVMNGLGVYGGGIRCETSASPTIRNCILRNNRAPSGGGLSCESSASPLLDHCILYSNASNSTGGGIFLSYANVTLDGCIISDSTSTERGGGLASYWSTLQATDCTFSGNATGDWGGAIYSAESVLTFANSIFQGNYADGYGGAMAAASNTPASATFLQCTFLSNTAASGGGGLYSPVKTVVANCIFVGHSPYAIDGESSDSGVLYSLFYNNTPGDLHCVSVFTGTAQINGASLNNKGNRDGSTYFAVPGDARINLTSRAVDWGSNNLGLTLPATDIDGNPRMIDGNGGGSADVDCGACEYNPAVPAIALSDWAVNFDADSNSMTPSSTTLQVGRGGGGTLHWQIDCNCPWLTAEPSSGTTTDQPTTVVLVPNATGMAPGMYQTMLTIRDPQAINTPRTVLVTLWVKSTRRVPSQYAKIQDALDAAVEGETVEVSAGTYREYLTLSKRIHLIGIGQPTLTPPTNVYSPGVSINAGGCTVSGFKFVGGDAGITVATSNNTVSNNLISGAKNGIVVYSGATGNALSKNEITLCTQTGLNLTNSSGNTFKDNHMHDNSCNFAINGYDRSDYIAIENDMDTSNTVDGKPIYYLVRQTGAVIGPESNAGCVVAVNSSKLTISGLTFSHNAYGVLLIHTTQSRIEQCVVTDAASGGIWVDFSSGSTLIGNMISGTRYGIGLHSSGGSTLTANTLSDCTSGVWLNQSTNCTLRDNILSGNASNFGCEGLTLSDFRQHIDTSNTADGKPICYLVGVTDAVIDASSNAACVYAVSCSRVTIRDLVFEKNGHGVALISTNDSTIENITVCNSGLTGVYLFLSARNIVRGSAISGSIQGLDIDECSNVQLDRDVIASNSRGVRMSDSTMDVTNCRVENNLEWGISCANQATGRILNCLIRRNGTGGSYSSNWGAVTSGGTGCYVLVANSILRDNPGPSVYLSYGGKADVLYCSVQGGYQGQGNIDIRPLLTFDGHLTSGSPCIRAGRGEVGCAPFDFDGEPRDPNGPIDIGCDQFVDDDHDGLPNWWETDYFGEKTVAAPGADADNDGHTNAAEYEVYSSNPTIPAIQFYVDAARPDDVNDGLSWPTAKKTIQAAVDLCESGDWVCVAPGLYPGNVTPAGRLIGITSRNPRDHAVVATTVLTGSVNINAGEGSGCLLAGLTISGRNDTGLSCQGSSPTIEDCLITDNYCTQYQKGGGLTLVSASPRLTRCTLSGNVSSFGGGLYCRSSQPMLDHCLLVGNVSGNGSGGEGMALYAEDSDVTLQNCTVAHNASFYSSSAAGYSAIQCLRGRLTIINSILWNSVRVQVKNSQCTVAADFTDIQGGNLAIEGLTGGTGNIAVDPCFVAAGVWDRSPSWNASARWREGDYHLRSAGWRWTPVLSHGDHWVWDEQTSCCIDAGDPASPLGEEAITVPLDPDHEWGTNVRIDMGAYGGTREASIAPNGWTLRADINNDGRVNLHELAYLGSAFGFQTPSCPADLTRNGHVGYEDLSIIAQQWLRSTSRGR